MTTDWQSSGTSISGRTDGRVKGAGEFVIVGNGTGSFFSLCIHLSNRAASLFIHVYSVRRDVRQGSIKTAMTLSNRPDKCYAIRISREIRSRSLRCDCLLARNRVSVCRCGCVCAFALRNYEDALIFNRKKLPTLDTAPTFNCFPYQRIMCCHVGNAFQCLVFSLDIFRQNLLSTAGRQTWTL
jgi:hypothetical protein